MINGKNVFVALACAAFIAGFTACGGKKNVMTPVVAGPIAANGPEWVNKGSGAFADANGTSVFYGVGMVSGVKNRALAVQAADQRARAEIAKSLDNYVAALTKDYMASTTAGDMKQSSEEQNISTTLKGFTKFTLQGSIIVDHWIDVTDGTVYALAKLDFANVKKTLDQAQELDSKVRDYVRANADKSFDELKQAEAASGK